MGVFPPQYHSEGYQEFITINIRVNRMDRRFKVSEQDGKARRFGGDKEFRPWTFP
jgi:hypothetical protein